MAGGKDENEKLAPIVIKRIKKGGGGHHGGAWKVAYADFVTAMMAFFLLLWLLNVTTADQKNAISNYFDPSHPKVSDVSSGAGGVLAGLSIASQGAQVSTVQQISQTNVPSKSTVKGKDEAPSDEKTQADIAAKLEEEARKKEDAAFKKVAGQLMDEITKSPELKDLANNLLIDITPEGLRIQVVDDKGRSMFPSGSAQMYDFMSKILDKVTNAIKPMPNQVSVRGHTDSTQYKKPNNYDNWNLSADRAQSSRRVMIAAGLPQERIENVIGRAAREPLMPKDPLNARNRRISIILLRDKKITQEAAKKAADIMQQRSLERAKQARIDALKQARDAARGLTPEREAAIKAQQAEAAAEAAKEAAETQAQNNLMKAPPTKLQPLPVSPYAQTTRPASNHNTQVEFGAEDNDEPLYKGEAQGTAYIKTPGRITTPVFHLPSQEGKTYEDTTPKQPSGLDFGDEGAGTLAIDGQQGDTSSYTSGGGQSLEFGADGSVPYSLNLDGAMDAPATPAPAEGQEATHGAHH